MTETATMSPTESWIGDIVSATSSRLPSLCLRCVSKRVTWPPWSTRSMSSCASPSRPGGIRIATLRPSASSAEGLHGYSAEEALGRSVAILMPPGREGEAQELIERMLHGGQVTRFETQRKHKDGSLLDVALTMSPIHDSVGDIVAVSVIGHDITERVRAERERRQSEEKFAAAFHASPDLISITRLSDGTILEVNEGFSQLLGYAHAEIIGKNTPELSIWADPADL